MKYLNFKSLAQCIFFCGASACFADGQSPKSNKVRLENFSESTCPGKDFESFFKVFAESETIQRKYTYSSVVSMWIEVDGVSEPTPFIETKSKDQLSFPLLPKASERKSRNLYFRDFEKNDNYVVLAGEDSGYLVRYIFIRSSCWHLIGIENMSI